MTDMSCIVIATPIKDSERLDFLPRFFDRKFIFGESLVYSFMEKLFSNYQGGRLEFFTLSNGGFYMAPVGYKKLICSSDNGFIDEMSSDAAGIVATLYTLNTLATKSTSDHFSEMYYRLINYLCHHNEGGKIYAAID